MTEEQKTANKIYTKQYHCNNCDRDFIKRFEFGEVAKKGKCPNCGVFDSDLNQPNLNLKRTYL